LRIYAPEKYTIEIDGKITPLAYRHSNEAGSANALSISDRQVPDYILVTGKCTSSVPVCPAEEIAVNNKADVRIRFIVN
jgi:hypothetical protein